MNGILMVLSAMSLALLIVSCNNISSSNESEPKKVEQYRSTPNKTVAKSSNQCKAQCENPQAECRHVEYLNTPAYQSTTDTRLPKDKIIEIENNFINTVPKSSIVANFHSSDSGWVDYYDGRSLVFSFLNDRQGRNGIYYISPHQNSATLSDFDQQMLLKIISISGNDNPQRFLQELLVEQPINHCSSCIIKQKQSKYGMIELSVCKADNAMTFSLYNPQLW